MADRILNTPLINFDTCWSLVLKFFQIFYLKAAFQNFKTLFSKKKNELKKANKWQINQIFNRRIKSYLKKDSVSTSLISCIKLLNPPFSSRFRNNSRTHFFFLFLFFVFFIKNKTTSCKNKMSSCSESDVISKGLGKFRFDIL